MQKWSYHNIYMNGCSYITYYSFFKPRQYLLLDLPATGRYIVLDMTGNYTIGKLSEKVGLPAKTIRYYEKIELITPARRGDNGYRLYDEGSVTELSLIKYARGLGLPIETMKKLMKGCVENSCHHTKSEIESEIESYILLLIQKILQLTTLRNKLKELEGNICVADTCDDPKYCCNILHQLTTLKGGE